MKPHQTEIIEVMRVVSQIEREIKAHDEAEGTLRPTGPSHGRLYERLGIFLVAMCRIGIHPGRALDLIGKMASMPDVSKDYLALLGCIQMDGDGAFLIPPNLQELMEC